jgi:hypothetical protein
MHGYPIIERSTGPNQQMDLNKQIQTNEIRSDQVLKRDMERNLARYQALD